MSDAPGLSDAPADVVPSYVEPVPASPSLNDATDGEPPTDGFTVREGAPGPSGSQPEVAEYPDAGAADTADGVVDGLLPQARDASAGHGADDVYDESRES